MDTFVIAIGLNALILERICPIASGNVSALEYPREEIIRQSIRIVQVDVLGETLVQPWCKLPGQVDTAKGELLASS